MKLAKLSLAAIVAAGALTSVASAASLEEAIKNVDVTGFARYRYDSTTTKAVKNDKDTDSKHRFTSDIDFKAAIDDNFFGVIGFRYDSRDASGERAGAATSIGVYDESGSDNNGQTFNVRQFYLGYTAGNTTIQAGRQVLGTFFTDDMVGTGIKVLNSDISGLTLAAIAFDNLQFDGDISTKNVILGKKVVGVDADGDITGDPEYVYDRNLYGAAAIGSYDPVSFQLWYAALDSVAQLYVADVTLSANLAGIDLALQAQAAGTSVWAHDVRAVVEKQLYNVHLDDATFLATELSAKVAGFDASAGYVNLNTKGDGYSLISFEDQGGFITAGEDLLDYREFNYDANIYFVTAGYTFADKVRVGADYVGARIDLENKEGNRDAYEAVARIDYKYNKKLNFKTWYSYIDRDAQGEDASHLRFEARYNF